MYLICLVLIDNSIEINKINLVLIKEDVDKSLVAFTYRFIDYMSC